MVSDYINDFDDTDDYCMSECKELHNFHEHKIEKLEQENQELKEENGSS